MTETVAYRVLARKYRPQTFADLIGQEAMVRTLRNAFASGRVAHAFVMTGVRGVGKTTTARIVAKGLNCVGKDGKGEATVEPCGVCGPCRGIAEGNHVDVMEIDAASNTQVDKMREILAGVPYRPAEARYKVYIFDEVHMLSTAAFNALLKTLEEPPAHVKFIFATTEIRKVPVTILSRCQRFDLRRIEPEVMLAHLEGICASEGVDVPPDALALIVRASEGSARDALSLLDQAIAHGAGATGAEEVRSMLGLADRARVLDLFEKVMRGDAAGALRELSSQYSAGADPLAVLRDLAEVTHWISVVKINPEAAEDPTISPHERERGKAMTALPMPALARAWQMLLKAIEEVAAAPSAIMAAEMAIIRLTHVADLPSPGDLARKLKDAPLPAPGATLAAPSPTGGPTAMAVNGGAPNPLARYAMFEDVMGLARARRDVGLLLELEDHVRLVSYAPGRIEFTPADGAPTDLAARIGARLRDWTGVRWTVAISSQGGAPTVAEARAKAKAAMHADANAHPLVAATLAAFPGARITAIRPRPQEIPDEAPIEELDDDWEPVDPFGED